MSEKEEVKNEILKIVKFLEEDGFSENNKRKYQMFRLEKEVIWPIDNNSVYKIVFAVSELVESEFTGYHYFAIKLTNKRGGSMISADMSIYIGEPIKIYSNILCAVKNIVDVACFLTRLIELPKSKSLYADISHMHKDDVFTSYEIEDGKLSVNIDFEENDVYVSISSIENLESRKGRKLNELINLDPKYIRENYKKLFPRIKLKPLIVEEHLLFE